MRCLSIERCLTRCIRKRASSRSRRTRGSGSQISGTKSRSDNTASTRASILSVLQASGARPLTLAASAISTSQPSSSSRSCTNRAPVIDSITPRTASPWLPTRRVSPRKPSASGGDANSSTISPPADSRQTSILRRLRSNPACNIKTGLLELAPSVNTPERATGEALLHGSPKHKRECGYCVAKRLRTRRARFRLRLVARARWALGEFQDAVVARRRSRAPEVTGGPSPGAVHAGSRADARWTTTSGTVRRACRDWRLGWK